jgi:esterase/lipase
MNKFAYRLFAVLLVSVVFCASPVAGSSMEEEITHLLNYIETSDCIFIRNGSRHDPKDAVKHIEKKYNYLKKRIKKTEDFIKGAATKSSISGKPYMIICNGKEMKTADCLTAE